MKYFKYIFFIAFFLLLPRVSSAFTCTAVAGGGNWNSASTWTGSCNSTTPQAGDDVVLDSSSGNVVINTNTASLKSFTMTGYTGTLSGSSQLTVSGATSATNNIIFDGTITWTGILSIANTNSNADILLTTNGKLLTAVSLAGGATGDIILQDNLSFTAVKTATLTILSGSNGKLDMNGFTISGNSSVNRLLVTSSGLNAQRQINRNGGGFANVDFREIDLEASYDCSAISGLCGDAGGNSADFTFTSSQTQYWIGGTGNASDSTQWSTSSGGSADGRVPLPQDDMVFDNGSFSGTGQIFTQDMPRSGKNIDFSAYSEAQAPRLTTSVVWTMYGSFTFNSNMTWTGANGMTFEGRGSHTLNTGGIATASGLTINMFGGTLTLGDALTTASIAFTMGNFDANNFNITVTGTGGFAANANNATRTITMGTGVWTNTSTSANAWSFGNSTGVTLVSTGSTIVLSNTTTTAKTFAGGGLTYNNLTIQGQNVTITGSNTFSGTVALSTAGRLVSLPTLFTTGTTQTAANWTVNSTSTDDYVQASSTTSTNATLAKSGGGTICWDFVRLQDMTGSPINTFYAGASSVDSGSTNVSISFTACPVVSGGNKSGILFFDDY